jgi:hypothetical protein
VKFEDQTAPTHRCKVCGAGWRFWRHAEVPGSTSDTWNLRNPTAGGCCLDANMGDQIEPMTAGHMLNWLAQAKAHHQASMPTVDQFAYSIDQESFTGPFDSVDQALAASQEDLASESEPGEVRAVWVGKVMPADRFLKRQHAHIGEDIGSRIDEILSDDIPADEPIIKMTAEQNAELGTVVVNWLKDNVAITRFAVVNVAEHSVTVEA